MAILLAVGFVSGLFSGAVRQVISFVAFVLGFGVACYYHQKLGGLLTGFLPDRTFCDIAAFAMLWVAVPIVAKLMASALTSLLDGMIAAGLLNRVLGGLLGLAKYGLVLGSVVWLFASMNLIKEDAMRKSRLAGPLKAVPEAVYHWATDNGQKQ